MRTTRLVTTIVTATLLLSACSAAEHDDADVRFAQEMIPHHQQATEMAALAPDRTDDAEVLDLARRIEAAQEPEIETMSGWLDDWDADPAADMSAMDSMPGMVAGDDLADLEDARGDAFDQRFLTLMIGHHEGAIAMARTQQSEGENDDAVDLARTIEQDQTAEIREMKALLAVG